jgi:hypothetical protein
MASWRMITGILMLAAALGLAGCAIVDEYSGRAVAYNIEAEQAQDQQLLLNLVRASLRRPMQFTSVSSITGQQSVSGTASVTVPFSNVMTKSGVFGGSVSGGPTFTVPVLDTQEFYRGILQGIPAELIDLLIHSGYSSELVFNLLIEKIEMTKVDDKECPAHTHVTECEFYVLNDVSSDTQIELFHTLVRYLVALGMTTEPRDDPSKPPPANNSGADSSGDNSNSKDTSSSSKSSPTPLPVPYVFCFAPKLNEVEAWIIPTSHCGYYPSDDKKQKSPTAATATLTATGTAPASVTATVTAAPPPPAPPPPSPKEPTCTNKVQPALPPTDAALQRAQIKRTAELTVCLSPEIVADMACIMGTYDGGGYYDTEEKLWDNFRSKNGAAVKVRLTFYMRSTSDLLNFLGQIVARDLNPGIFRPEYAAFPRRIWIGDATTFRFKIPRSTEPYDPKMDPPLKPSVVLFDKLNPAAGPCRCYFDANLYKKLHHEGVLYYENLFVLERDVPLNGYLAVAYGGHVYSMPDDPAVAGWTTQVLGITKQLLAVNTSAATLPQTSVISIVGSQ